MNTIATVTVGSELVASAPSMRPDAPPRESIEPPDRPSADVRRADERGARPADGREDFASTLAVQIEAGEEGTVTARGDREPAPAATALADDGEDAPPGGNGLPPWFAGLPPPAVPSAAAPVAVPALDTGGPRERLSNVPAGLASATSIARQPATVPIGAPLVDTPPAQDETMAVAMESAVPLPAAADDPPAAAPDSVPLANGRTLTAQARAEGPSPVEPALQNAVRYGAAPPAIAPGGELPASASDAALPVARTPAGHATPASPLDAAASTPAGRRPTAGVAVATRTLAVVDAAAAPLLPRATRAARAADGEPSTDVGSGPASVPTPLPSSSSLAALLATASSPASAAAASPPTLPIPAAVGAPEWDRQLGERVGVLVEQGLTNAQLKLSPAHLGPLEIRISVQNDQANVWFGTHSHATREALEAAAPRLRDMLGAQGFTHVGVSVDLQQQPSRRDPPAAVEPEFSFAAGAAGGADAARAASAATPTRVAARPRLDAFA